RISPPTFGLLAVLIASVPVGAVEIYVSPSGQDGASGTRAAPLQTLPAAQRVARKFLGRERVTILLRGGVYYLADAIVFTAGDSGTRENPVTYTAAPGEDVVLSG